MRLLLDTQALIWHYEAHASLGAQAKNLINNTDNQLFISVVNLWEIAIKVHLGKLTLQKDIHDIASLYQKAGALILPITQEHVYALQRLPWPHRDPFDRILIAQAVHEDLILISNDSQFIHYPVTILW
jgi:PIN domain nuclease of toxin-antitoxin system